MLAPRDPSFQDEALRKQSTASSGSGAAPAPRGKAAGPTGPVDASLQQLPAAFRVPGAGGTQPPAPGTKVRRKKAKAKPAPLPASHTYENYRDRWDKFDVDAALAESDESEYEWVEVEVTLRLPSTQLRCLRRRPRENDILASCCAGGKC